MILFFGVKNNEFRCRRRVLVVKHVLCSGLPVFTQLMVKEKFFGLPSAIFLDNVDYKCSFTKRHLILTLALIIPQCSTHRLEWDNQKWDNQKWSNILIYCMWAYKMALMRNDVKLIFHALLTSKPRFDVKGNWTPNLSFVVKTETWRNPALAPFRTRLEFNSSNSTQVSGWFMCMIRFLRFLIIRNE